ncbi:MAG: ABC transporter permease [Halobacteriales archaeon]|nr:ABC transporter permease [Halobacteriales archaeon]
MNVDVAISSREDVPAWLIYGAPVFTVVAALAVGAVALVALRFDPIAVYNAMFIDTLTGGFGLTNMLIRAVPLILAGLAVYLPLRGGLWNIGAEGQIYVGAIAGTWVGLNIGLPAIALIPLMLAAAAGAGAVWAGVPGWLRAKWDVNEIITTLLLTFVAIELNGYMVRGPMQGGEGNFPVSALLPEAARIPLVPGTEVHIGILVALLAGVAVYALLRTTRLGFEITFVGSNPDAARQAGMNSFWVYVFVLVAGGALAAMAGVIEVAGVQSRLRPEFSPGYGFTAIPIALLGRNGAPQVVLAGLFFAVIFVGGFAIRTQFGVPNAMVDVLQALIILFLITAEFVKAYEVSIDLDLGSGAAKGEAA